MTVGHPACAVHNCHVPLLNQRHRFCPQHVHLDKECAVKGCHAPVTEGSKVCGHAVHKNVEKHYFARGQAMFQLHRRLDRARMAAAGDVDLTNLDEDEEEFIIDAEGNILHGLNDQPAACPDKDIQGGKITVQFSRGRTHNEQIIVCPCGVIIARVTFYGAEAVTSVIVCLLPCV